LKPSLYTAQLNLGALEMEQGQWAQALAPTEAAVKLQPDSSAAYLQRGIIQAALGKSDAAVADFTQSISKNSKEINALYNRGNIYFQQSKYALANQDFE
jgi:Tfp pilus assembly protein PilF